MDKMTFNSVEKGIIQLRKTKEEITDACKKGSSKRSNAPVPQNSIIGALLCFLCIMFWLLTASSIAHGARVAGEKGVTPGAPEAAPPAVQPPAEKPAAAPAPEMPVAPAVAQPAPKPPAEKPATVKPPPKAPARAPARAQEKRRPKPVPPAKKEAPSDRYVTIDFDDVDITLFIKFISELTGKNFVVDKAVRGKVTIISPKKISVAEAYKVFQSVLEVHGFATVPAGSVTKIVPAVAARSKSIETRIREEAIDPEDRIVTQLIPLSYASPDALKKLFAPFISKSSVMVSYSPTGTLIVTDVLSNIKRLLSIIRAIDVVGIGEEISVVPLEYATASVLVKSITSVFQTKTRRKGAPVGPGIKTVADERTNSLIIAASEDDTIKVRQLVNLLDKEIPRGEGDIRVYYLQNANAEDLAGVLTALPSKTGKGPQKGKAPVISKETQIVADKATNSLVITANKDDYLILEDVIKKLDIARRMVYIEALIMEVNTNKRFTLGVQWVVADDIGSWEGRDIGGFAGSTPPSGIFPAAATGTVGLNPGFSLGVLGEAINIGGINFPSIGAVISAFQSDTDIHILQTPQLMTTDNEEAEILVVENIPFLTRQDQSDSGVDYSNYEFKDVGVTLKITPQINQDRFVRLKIFQEISQVVEQEEIGLPTTLKRTAETTVIIKDRHTVVIGGLIDEIFTRGTSSVPCLGNIPLLGGLFKTQARSKGKSNLFIFLTPHIIENPEEATVVYEEKKEYIEEVEERVIKMYERPEREGEETEVEESELEGTDVEEPTVEDTDVKDPNIEGTDAKESEVEG
jgi:general secretion pathway protein D